MKKKELLQMLEDLQSQVAFQEDTLQGLQAALSSQQQDLLVVLHRLQCAGARLATCLAQTNRPHFGAF